MNIDGISIATVEKFISLGFIKEYADLFRLEKYKNQIIELEGFGEKSYDNIIDAVNQKRETELYRVINSFGINGIGTANAKVLAKHFNNDFHKIRKASVEELCDIDSIGPVLANSIYEFFRDKNNIKMIDDLLSEINIIGKTSNNNDKKLDGLIFVITGSLNNFTNRDELVKVIEDNGGKSSSSVSKKTSYLINNDTTSNSSKNKTAKELGVKIISENEFLEMIK